MIARNLLIQSPSLYPALQSMTLGVSRFARVSLAVFCATFALLLLAGPVAQASSFLVGKANVCFAERVGDNLKPAWNASFDGEETLPVAAEPEGAGPVFIYFNQALTETSAEIGDNFFNWLDVYITGLSLGQSVLLERFFVDNDEGIINGNAVLMESHRIQDGFRPLTGNIPNLSSVEDWDATRDGKIWTQLGMFGGLANMPGEYVIRVSSPLDSFPPATARLTINEVPTDQFFVGQVVDDWGDPIPYAFVALLAPLGSYSDIRYAARADEDGDYLLYAPNPDEVDLVAVAPGYVGPYQGGSFRVIEKDDVLIQDIELTPGTVNLAGHILREGSNEPIAGLPVTFFTVDESDAVDGRLMTHTWTDANGAFSVMLTPDRWQVVVKTYEAASRNLLETPGSGNWIFDLTDGVDVSNVEAFWIEATSLVAGVLRSKDGDPLQGVQMLARNLETRQTASGYTLANGTFTLAAAPGDWEVTPFSFDLEFLGYPGVEETQVRLTAPNQSVVIFPTAPAIKGVLEGLITYESADSELDGTAVGGLMLWAQNIVEGELMSVFQSTYRSSGYYNFFLPEGHWFVIPEPFEAARRQLLLKNLPVLDIVEDEEEIISRTEWDIIAVDPTRSMQIIIRDEHGDPVPGIPMHAHRMTGEGEDTYDAFGVTDDDGVAIIPAIGGHWHFHISHSTMRRAGFVQFTEEHLMVSEGCGEEPEECPCGPALLELTAVPFTGALPEVTRVASEAGRLVIEGTGEPGQLYEVEGSFDLQNWRYTGDVIALDGAFTITDLFDAGHEQALTDASSGRLFYRLKNRE